MRSLERFRILPLVTLTGERAMHQSVKEELVQTLDRLSPEKLLVVLRFARSIEQQTTEQTVASAGYSDAEVARALADFVAAAGCGQSGDPQSSLRVDSVLYSRPQTS
jgi:hypothetical protein